MANATDTTADKLKTFFDVAIYISFVPICLGTLGNLMTMAIFYRRWHKDRVSAQYLALLAFFDFCNITIFAPVKVGQQFRIGLPAPSTTLQCQLFIFSWHLVSLMSAWIIVIFSLERVLVIWFPIKSAPIISSSKYRKYALSLTFAIGSTLYGVKAPWIEARTIDKENGIIACLPGSNMSEFKTGMNLFLVLGLGSALPCILIFVVNILILVGIARNTIDQKSSTKSTKSERRTLINLLLVSTFFFIFMMPYAILWCVYLAWERLNGFAGLSESQVKTFGTFANFSSLFTFWNYAINPVLYTLSLDYYRKECVTILTCGRAKPKDGQAK